jgi:bifunctional enzyme CysN/CysC/sulfate adenylyltransferase subunit 1
VNQRVAPTAWPQVAEPPIIAPAAAAPPSATTARDEPSLLRLITCGSVDDGKSTLIGRLLFEADQIPDDQLAHLQQESARRGTDIDFSLLVDGLAAEREQGITIDVAYRYFGTGRRKFIVADTPGHEQYTRNMATAASTADLAVLLVDARKGILPQTRRHSLIVALLGVRHVVLAVNKMDAVGFDAAVFKTIETDFRDFADGLGFDSITCLPVSAKGGDNVTALSLQMPWYRGPALLPHLETVDLASRGPEKPFRMPVQWVSRLEVDGRGYCGLVAAGRVRRGDAVAILPSGRRTTITGIRLAEDHLEEAVAGQSVTLILDDAIDVSRGDLLAAAAEPPTVGNQLSAKLLWVSSEPLQPGRSYLLKAGTATVSAVVDVISAHWDIATGAIQSRQERRGLALNEIGLAKLTLGRRLALDSYPASRATGGFILIDRLSNDTVAMGLIDCVEQFTPPQRVDDSYASMEGLALPERAPAARPDRLPAGVSAFLIELAVIFTCALAIERALVPAAAIALAAGTAQLALRRVRESGVLQRLWRRR